MSAEGKRRWTLIVVREGEVRSRTVALSRRRVILLATVVLSALAAVFFVAGRWVGDLSSAGVIEALKIEVSDLQRENAAMAIVAERVERLETEYRQLRAVMGGELGRSQRDILLPPLSEKEVRARRVSEEEASAGFVWPVVEQGFVTRSFGDTATAPPGGHMGVDIAVPVGSYVRSSRAGRVTEAGEAPEYGLYVRVAHDDDLTSLYAHNSWLFVAPGDSVEMGEVIALSGNSGRSTAPHLHVEIERQEVPVDPLDYLVQGT